MNSDFDPKWPHGHVTRDGRKARILATDFNNDEFTIIAAITHLSGKEGIRTYTAAGRYFNNHKEDSADLFNAPAPKVKYVTYVAVFASIGNSSTWSDVTSMPLSEEKEFRRTRLQGFKNPNFKHHRLVAEHRFEWEMDAPT